MRLLRSLALQDYRLLTSLMLMAIRSMLAYVSGSGTASATFVYTVQDGDISGGIDIASTSSLDLNGGQYKRFI